MIFYFLLWEITIKPPFGRIVFKLFPSILSKSKSEIGICSAIVLKGEEAGLQIQVGNLLSIAFNWWFILRRSSERE